MSHFILITGRYWLVAQIVSLGILFVMGSVALAAERLHILIPGGARRRRLLR